MPKYEYPCRSCVHCKRDYSVTPEKKYCELTGRNIGDYDQNDYCSDREVE